MADLREKDFLLKWLLTSLNLGCFSIFIPDALKRNLVVFVRLNFKFIFLGAFFKGAVPWLVISNVVVLVYVFD